MRLFRTPSITLRIVPIAAGAGCCFALAPVAFWPIMFITVPALVWSLDRATAGSAPIWKTGFATGWLFGFGYFLAGLYWIGVFFLEKGGAFVLLMPIAVLVVSAALAVFYGLAAMLAYTLASRGFNQIIS